MAQAMAAAGSTAIASETAASLNQPALSVWLNGFIISIASAALFLPLSQAADYFGQKIFILIPSIVAVIGFLIVSRAENAATAIAGHSIGGVGLSYQPLLYIAASETMPRRCRPLAQASLSVTTAVGGVIGTLAASSFLPGGNIENNRIFWYIVTAINALAAIAVYLGFRPAARGPQSELTTKQKVCTMDWVGYVLIVFGFILIPVASRFYGNTYNWDSPRILGPFVTGFGIFGILIIHEMRFHGDVMFKRALLMHRDFGIANNILYFASFSLLTSSAFLAVEAGVLFHLDTFHFSLRNLTMFLSTILFAPLVALYSSWRKTLRQPLISGYVALLVFNILMATIRPATSPNVLWGYPILLGFAMGTILPSAITAAQLSVAPGMISIATGLLMAFKTIGTGLAGIVNSVIFQKTLPPNLGSKVATALLPLGIQPERLGDIIQALNTGDLSLVGKVLNGDPQAIQGALVAFSEAYALSFRYLWICASAAAAVGLIASIFVHENESLFNEEAEEAPITPRPFGAKSGDEAGATHIEAVDSNSVPSREE
ncbi:major facilitator superfamily domain-containing protein [Aspergillus heterothallicus]